MSDHSQIIADIDATTEEAELLARSIRLWLTSEGIIDGEPTDSVLGGYGYRAADRYLGAVETGNEVFR